MSSSEIDMKICFQGGGDISGQADLMHDMTMLRSCLDEWKHKAECCMVVMNYAGLLIFMGQVLAVCVTLGTRQ